MATVTIGCANPGDSSQTEILQVKGSSIKRLPEVEAGTRIEQDFELTSTSSEVITLDEPRTSCGCSEATLSSTRLGPGEKSTLHMVIMAAITETKAQVVSAMVRIAKPIGHSPVVVGVEFGVGLPWELKPKDLQFVGPAGTRMSGTVFLYPRREKELKILSAKCGPQDFLVDVGRSSGGDLPIPIHFTGVMPDEVGVHRSYVEIITSVEKMPLQRCDIRYETTDFYKSTPKHLIVNLKSTGGNVEEMIKIQTNESLALRDPTADSDGIKCEVLSEGESGVDHRLKIQVNVAKFLSGYKRVLLKIRVIGKAAPRSISIPVVIIRSASS